MSRTLLLLSVVGCAFTAFATTPNQGGNAGQTPVSGIPAGKEPTAAELEVLLGLHAPTAEELAADELDPAFVAKKDGKLILEQLAARAKTVVEGLAPNYTVYRGMKVGMALKADMLVLQVAPEITTDAAVLEASKLGLRVKEASRTGAGDYVMLTLIDPIKDLDTAAAWVNALAASPVVAFASPVFVTPLRDDAICFPTAQMRVRVDTAVLGSGATAAKMSAFPVSVVDDKLGTISGGALLKITGKSGFEAMRAANTLASMTDFGILYAECDMMQQVILADIIPNDPEFVNQWQHRNTGQYGGWTAGVDMNTPPAWELSTGSSIRIGVLDVGVQQNHPDINQIGGSDFTTGAANGVGNGAPLNFCENHGTPCASIISSFFNNSSGGAGLAPNAQTFSCRIAAQNQAPASCSNSFTSASFTWLVNAMARSAAIGCKATSNSYGFGGTSQALDDQISNNYNNGCATFVSTGNDSAGTIGYPSSSPSAIAIGAMDPSGVIAGFSNRGNGISMVGPGVFVRAGDRTGSDGYAGADITWFAGTSAACPTVAGVAALVVSAHPHLSSAGLKFFLQAFCRDFGAAGYDTTYGFGMPNALRSINGFAPDNDECGNARIISGLNYSNSSNNFNATFRAAEPNESCGADTSATVYWKYASTAYGTASINTFGSDFDTVLSVFNGCGFSINLGGGPIYLSPTQLACNDDSGGLQSALTLAMSPGSQYTVKVGRFGQSYPVGGNANLNFSFAPAPPPNDSFFASTLLSSTVAQTITGTTNYATNDSGSLPTCGLSEGAPDVWYYITPTCDANYTVSTFSSNFDTVLTVYTGGIFNRTLVTCNDDCNPPDRNSCVSFSAVSGQSYYIRVSGFNGLAGVFNLSIAAPVVPNDTCENAINIAAGAPGLPTATFFNNGCATDSAGLSTVACSFYNTIYKDVWYNLTLDADSTVDLDTTTSSFDTVIAVYNSCPAPGEVPLACNDDSNGTLQSALTFTATAGANYKIRVGGYSPDTVAGNGVLYVAATAVVVPPTCLADVNADGVVDGGDFTAFINSFGTGDVAVDPVADVNLDGTIDGSDFIEFINAFSAGC